MDEAKDIAVEISLSFGDDDNFYHEGYYDSIQDAIDALYKLKEMYIEN